MIPKGPTQDDLRQALSSQIDEHQRKLRRKIEEALRKTAKWRELEEIAKILGVKV